MDSCDPRTATGDDAPQLLRLWTMLFDQDDSPVHRPWRINAREWFDRFVDDASSARFPVIEMDGDVVATAVAPWKSASRTLTAPREELCD